MIKTKKPFRSGKAFLLIFNKLCHEHYMAEAPFRKGSVQQQQQHVVFCISKIMIGFVETILRTL